MRRVHFYRQPLPRNIHRVTDLTEKKIWGINSVIGYRTATEKYSQTIILVIILAATVFHVANRVSRGVGSRTCWTFSMEGSFGLSTSHVHGRHHRDFRKRVRVWPHDPLHAWWSGSGAWNQSCELAWPSNPYFLEKKSRETLRKQGFFFVEPLKSLEKEGKTLKKGQENRKTKKARKSKKARIGGSGLWVIRECQ